MTLAPALVPLALQAVETAHPLAATPAHWIWLVLVLPLVGAAVNGVLGVITDWRPGPFDPDPVHTGEFPIPSATLVERAERATPMVMTVIEGHRPRAKPGPGDHGDHHEEGDDAGSHAPPARHPFLGLVSIVGTGVVAAAFAVAVAAFLAMLRTPSEAPYVLTFWDWVKAGPLHIPLALRLDQLSIVMTLVITGVGTLIHLFSIGYMRDDGSYARYFAYLNLFVFFMLLLVLGANYAVMFVGWEGVGLCSFLLIGFWFTEKANADAGKKAFIVNRIGDFGLLVAMFLIFANLGTLDFARINEIAPSSFAMGGAGKGPLKTFDKTGGLALVRRSTA